MASLNLVLMVMFYLFVLCPLFTFILIMPMYLYKVYTAAHNQRRRKLLKHYVIKAMPSILFNKKLFKDLGVMPECGICMDPFLEEGDFVTPLYCQGKHVFHSNCIEGWFEKKNQCPLCRAPQTPQ
jgi:hypothetical protein